MLAPSAQRILLESVASSPSTNTGSGHALSTGSTVRAQVAVSSHRAKPGDKSIRCCRIFIGIKTQSSLHGQLGK